MTLSLLIGLQLRADLLQDCTLRIRERIATTRMRRCNFDLVNHCWYRTEDLHGKLNALTCMLVCTDPVCAVEISHLTARQPP
ncbi:hypothetical protein A4F85_06655 [Delftia sp. GW456-R20]|nr:hypothetical protein A4F85_06655 [Delftia sp. GW456-R20]